MEYEFSGHALKQIERRVISVEIVQSVLKQPDLIGNQGDAIRVYAKFVEENSKVYLYRIFVNHLKKPALIITAYKTSKVKKYGNQV